jgi:hypothetical protein
MSSDSDARPSKPLPRVLTAPFASAPTSSVVLDGGLLDRLHEFGKKMREEHALRGELAKVLIIFFD